MKIAVGSINPIKIKATENVMKKIYKKIKIIPVEVKSKVSHTPIGDKKTILGAINRARESMEKTDADLGIGLEGGISKISKRYFITGWVAVMDKKGDVSLGGGSTLEIPKYIVDGVLKNNKELGVVLDEVTGMKNTKKKMGCIGIFTNTLMDRKKAWEIMLTYAMSKRLRPDLYK